MAALRDSRFLIAFQDLNQDFSYQANEPTVRYKLTESEIKSGDVSGIELLLQGTSNRPVPPTLEKIFNLRGSSLGKIDVQS